MQAEFQFKEPEADDKLAALLLLLAKNNAWHPAKQITQHLSYSDRQIRALAASSRGQIVSGPGCPGYKHLRHCTAEEINEVASRLEHQAKLMAQRAQKIRGAWHKQA